MERVLLYIDWDVPRIKADFFAFRRAPFKDVKKSCALSTGKKEFCVGPIHSDTRRIEVRLCYRIGQVSLECVCAIGYFCAASSPDSTPRQKGTPRPAGHSSNSLRPRTLPWSSPTPPPGRETCNIALKKPSQHSLSPTLPLMQLQKPSQVRTASPL